FIITFPGMFLQIVLDFHLFPDNIAIIMYYQYSWIIDAKCFCSSITLIFVNRSFRQELLQFFKYIRPNTFKVTSVSDGKVFENR
ncbi:hypothetical protein PFISCL1PPCAC_14540, partial [Pristionchus fissidentatus]